MSSSKPRLLIVSPSPQFAQNLISESRQDLEVQRANSEQMALFLSSQWEPHLCLVDGDSNLSTVCGLLRDSRSPQDLGIIALFQNADLIAEEKAFRAGCDQVISRPPTAAILHWRLLSLLKRVQQVSESPTPHPIENVSNQEESCISFRGLSIYPKDHIIKRGDLILTATPIQFKLLLTFLSHREQLLSRSTIKNTVWEQATISPRSIDAQISKLKRLIPELEPCLINIYGKGYLLTEYRRQAA